MRCVLHVYYSKATIQQQARQTSQEGEIRLQETLSGLLTSLMALAAQPPPADPAPLTLSQLALLSEDSHFIFQFTLR